MKRLWEIDHPYYMNEGNYYSNGCHTEYKTWSDFVEEWQSSDMDYNWFVRWDWLEGDDNNESAYNGDDYYRNGRFLIQRIGQRKSLLDSHEVSVCRADEPKVFRVSEALLGIHEGDVGTVFGQHHHGSKGKVMGEYAEYELQRWIRAGMPESRSPYTKLCEFCGSRERTDSGNWTFCQEVKGWHGRAYGRKGE